jgi:D-arabinose 1-dehydrogenase-like Zn-dependent alcohol dehydrogenase
MRQELICVAPASPARLAVRSSAAPKPGRGEILVRVRATSVNPIDVKRAAGYGRRLLGLKGAASFPLIVGNDVAGHVEAVGAGITAFAPGAAVFGLVGTGKHGGAHASLVVVPQDQLVAAPERADPQALAVLPYSFTTMWLAVRSTGLNASNGSSARVLILGACGGLGQLSLQMLRGWGCRVTAICAAGQRETCLALGAENAVERGPGRIESLPDDFDVTLNFGSWEDDALLATRLGRKALGQATTVHPLLGNFDRLGWLRGAAASWQARRRMRSLVAARAPNAHYSWTVFAPNRAALVALSAGVREKNFSLPVGVAVPFEHAQLAFEHVANGGAGRAVLLPA